MICANCKKEINLSFGASGFNGCYCEKCAKEMGFFPNIETRPKNIQVLTPEQHIVKHIHYVKIFADTKFSLVEKAINAHIRERKCKVVSISTSTEFVERVGKTRLIATVVFEKIEVTENERNTF